MKNEDLYVYKKSDFYEDFISSQKEYYEREQVDTLLAEKDREIALLKEHIANGDVSRITWIDEVIELKQKLHDAEMREDLAEAANTEYRIDLKNIKDNLAKHARNQYHKHNRQTLRALWLARAYRGRDNSILLPSKFMRNVWEAVESKCRAKAEEYR